jgi:hypothetical protein
VRGRDKNNFKKEETKWENCWFWVFLAGLVTAFTEKENTLARERDSALASTVVVVDVDQFGC